MNLFAEVAYAAGSTELNSIISRLATEVINPLIKLAFAVATIVFLWGAFKLIKDGADPTARAAARQHLLWGILGLFIMVSAFGIINLILKTIGL